MSLPKQSAKQTKHKSSIFTFKESLFIAFSDDSAKYNWKGAKWLFTKEQTISINFFSFVSLDKNDIVGSIPKTSCLWDVILPFISCVQKGFPKSWQSTE